MKRRNGGSMLRRLLLVLAAAMVAVFVSAAVGSAVTQDEPEHTKTLVNNHDGTYTLSLDVKGATRESTTDVSANVIVVMDISTIFGVQRQNSEPFTLQRIPLISMVSGFFYAFFQTHTNPLRHT